MAERIRARAESLLGLLAVDTSYEVPPYQRDYSWDIEATTRLFEDVTRVPEGPESYFLGAMVFVVLDDKQNRFEVLDGQQRFASLLLMLRALQRVLEDRHVSASKYNHILSMLRPADIHNNHAGEDFVHIQMNDDDREFFNVTIETGETPEPERRSHRLIRDALELFLAKFQEAVPGDPAGAEDYWKSLRRRMTEDLYVIRVEVGDEADAQLIFEALNTAGMDLTASDLIKNHVLRQMSNKDQRNKTYQVWRSMVETIGDDDLTRYLRASWNSMHEFAREGDLYKLVKKQVIPSGGSGHTKPAEYVAILEKEAGNWLDIQSPDAATWAGSHSNLREHLQDLKEMDSRLALVPLLALFAAHPKDFALLEDASRLFRDFYVRHTIVGQRAANEVEQRYSEWAAKIRKGKLTVADLRKELQKLSPSDAEFEGNFAKFEIKRQATARVLLARLNDSVKKDNVISKTITDGKKIHLEHVIPQKPEKWETFLAAENLRHEDVINRLGNLTLLLGTRNIQASNKVFKDKVATYKASEAPINEYLASLSNFGAAELEERSKRLAKFAVSVWTLT